MDLKKTPLFDWHKEHGAKMADFGGWDMPIQYETGILDEHLATRRYGGLFDVSHMGRFLVRGRDADTFLQHVLTSNISALRTGQAQYTIIPDHDATILTEDDLDPVTVASHGLVYRIINNLVDKMMKAPLVSAADVHARPLPDSCQSL